MTSTLMQLCAGFELWSGRANRIAEILLFAIGLGMAILTGAQVFSRYLLNHSLFWSEEVGRICLVWISFLGASAAYKRRVHIGVDFLVVRLPRHIQHLTAVLVLLLSMLFFSILIAYGASFAYFVAGQKTAALGLPLIFPYLVVPVSGALFLLHALTHLCRLLQHSGGEK
jgi:TRAP-type C4-dicarboxylate transport system permease small subunit